MSHTYSSYHPAPEWVIEPLIEVMSGADRSELLLLSQDIEGGGIAALRTALQVAAYSFSHTVDGTPVALGGISPPLPSLNGMHCVWMVASTPLLERVPKAFLRESRNELAAMRLLSPTGMRAMVDARWRKSVRWLKWLGFKEQGRFEYKGRQGLILERLP